MKIIYASDLVPQGTAVTCKEFEMVICPKCGYLRQPKDDDFVSKNECPKCGIVYEKFERTQRQMTAANNMVYLEKRNTKRTISWSAVVLLFAIGIFIAKSNGLNKSLPINQTAGPPPLNWQTHTTQPKPVSVISTARPPVKDGGRDISNATNRILQAYNQPLDGSRYYRNDLDEYQWDSLKSLPNYARIQLLLSNYHRQHTYVGGEFFVCVDMAMEVWDLLTTAGIPARLMVGNAQTDITLSPTVKRYLSDMNHAWVLAEVSPSTWIPLETTGGFIVEPSMPNFRLYNVGAVFESPKAFKNFNESRTSMFSTCSQIIPMEADFNRLYAGRPLTGDSTEYTGRIKQKIDDCQGLVGRVTAFLQPR